jgi:hypothetical protein
MAQVALLTQHGKARAFEGLCQHLGHTLVLTTAFDTDLLGTFTGERKRVGHALDAAKTKAQKACELTGLPYGLGSEGSFGPDPYMGSSPWGVELVCWWDAQRNYSVHALAQGPQASYRQQSFSTAEEALHWATQMGFPEQGVVVGRPHESVFSKSAACLNGLRDLVENSLRELGAVWLETDMRAHRNPARMDMIAAAANNLSLRLALACPACELGGFGPVRLLPGARCSACGHSTSAARAQVLQCPACQFEHEEALRTEVPPARCEVCNP